MSLNYYPMTVENAKKFAREKHEGQLDDNDMPYFFHLHQVAMIIYQLDSSNYDLRAAAYLHDIIEDTDVTYEELVEKFGKKIADLVMEVTHEGEPDNIGYWFPRLHSKEGIKLKFADRLSNLSRMQAWDIGRVEHYLRKSKFWKSSAEEELTFQKRKSMRRGKPHKKKSTP